MKTLWHLWRASRTLIWWACKREVSRIQDQVPRTSCSSWRTEVEAAMQLRVVVLAVSLTAVTKCLAEVAGASLWRKTLLWLTAEWYSTSLGEAWWP